jgi:hypothetical protein
MRVGAVLAIESRGNLTTNGHESKKGQSSQITGQKAMLGVAASDLWDLTSELDSLRACREWSVLL